MRKLEKGEKTVPVVRRRVNIFFFSAPWRWRTHAARRPAKGRPASILSRHDLSMSATITSPAISTA